MHRWLLHLANVRNEFNEPLRRFVQGFGLLDRRSHGGEEEDVGVS